jgi:cytochrome c553
MIEVCQRAGLVGAAAPARRWRRPLAVGLLVALATGPAAAADLQAGRQKAQACAVCHGPQGLSVTPDAPNLAGQPAIYLAAQLKAYRGGSRKHEVMAVMAKPLSDDDIDNLSAWFNAIRVEARLPD